ncbi:MAG: D-alanyl-D-alanine carboxypeptidase family protein, partial [Lachnospiraceae bacterium]
HVGGSIANFATMMNKKAEELGCLNTHFSNASGLTDVNHYTTAYDMAIICRAVIDVPAIMNAISYTKSYSVPPTNMTSDTRYYKLSHSMVTGKYLYEYCIGGKTGYTDAAGHTLATFAEKDGLRLICIIFNSTDEERYQDTTALFEYAFNNFHRVNISENEDSFSFNQGLGLSAFGINGKALKSRTGITLSIPSEDYLLIPNGVHFSELSREIVYNQTTKESELSGGYASIYYYYDNHPVGQTNLIIPMSSNTTISTGLPYLTAAGSDNTDTVYTLQGGRYIAVNLWLFIGAVCIIVLIIVLILHSKKTRHDLRFD